MEKLTEFDFDLLENLPDFLVKDGLVSKDQLAVAKVTQKNLGGNLGQILIKKGFIEEERLIEFIREKLKIPFVSLAEYGMEPAVVKLVPQSVAQKYKMIPLFKAKDVLTIAVSDLLDLFSIREIRGVVKCMVQPVQAAVVEIDEAIDTHYRLGEWSSISEEIVEVVDYLEGIDENSSELLEEMASGAKVVAAVNGLISRAYKDKASDIHVEPMRNKLKIRYRIDGILEERMLLPKTLHLPIISRLKIMGDMDIAERRVPQDGRVRVSLMGEDLDLRLSTYPTMYGEKIVMRLLPKATILGLEALGFTEKEKDKFTEIIIRPYGIFLVTGPTGSGKSTTLYAALQRVNSQERNIVSIEDPVENEIPGVNQAQINLKAGVTFASALKSILRQDPDIIMIGEIRDKETADMSVRAAMTGHLVFSTLHTNTAIGAIARLLDLGVESFLISSALLGVMAQRLVRNICPHCKHEVTYDEDFLKKFLGDDIKIKDVKLFKGKGCKRCRMSGYSGRTGIFELVHVDENLNNMIAKGATEEEMQRYINEIGVPSIREAGIIKVLHGITTIDEVLRVTEG